MACLTENRNTEGGPSEDRLNQFNLSDEAQIKSGLEALERLADGQVWADWMSVGAAHQIGRNAAMREANTNQPFGRRYNEAFGDWLIRHGFDRLDKSVRARLMECMDRRTEIEAWRSTLPVNKRMQLNHPATVVKHWKAATQIPRTDQRPSPMAKLQAAHVEVLEENHRLQREITMGGGDLWTPQDAPAVIARVVSEKLTVDKLERTARAMLEIAKQRRQSRKAVAGAAANRVAAP